MYTTDHNPMMLLLVAVDSNNNLMAFLFQLCVLRRPRNLQEGMDLLPGTLNFPRDKRIVWSQI